MTSNPDLRSGVVKLREVRAGDGAILELADSVALSLLPEWVLDEFDKMEFKLSVCGSWPIKGFVELKRAILLLIEPGERCFLWPSRSGLGPATKEPLQSCLATFWTRALDDRMIGLD